jgi:hypothetical protein
MNARGLEKSIVYILKSLTIFPNSDVGS